MKIQIKELEAQHALQIMDYEDMLSGVSTENRTDIYLSLVHTFH